MIVKMMMLGWREEKRGGCLHVDTLPSTKAGDQKNI
jgi:hypothetical protein